MILQFLEKGFRFPEKLLQTESIENVQIYHWLSQKTCRSLKGYSENP